MASLLCVARKFLFPSDIIRGRSFTTETFSTLGKHGEIDFQPARVTPFRDYLKKKPLLLSVPANRIFGDGHRCMTNDPARRLCSSAIFLPYFSKLHGKSYSGAFTEDNVGVVEDLGILVFKDLVEDADRMWLMNESAGYNECGLFLESLFSERPYYSPPDEMKLLFKRLKAPQVKENVIDHAALLSDLEYGEMVIEVYRVLRQESRVTRGRFSYAMRFHPLRERYKLRGAPSRILSEIGRVHLDCVNMSGPSSSE